VSPEDLADAYGGNYERRQSLERSRARRPAGLDADKKVILEGPGLRVVAVRHQDDEPQTGLQWGWAMVDCIATGETWEDDAWDAQQEGRAVRFAPAIDRLELLELLAEQAPDDDAARFLGADALENYLGSNPDVARVERAAQRSERFRLALAAAWFDSKLAPEDVTRLRRFGGRGL
jgi:hypothetical protein